ncbi:unnamed protein product [Ambrosiozyma monospora]|uniref:Unnamed protein product n=1 Tax=Ambrosiozyma monospora TaxID=43982 RepID=A0ACB5U4D5_AMBMO|nr:unnamed protein product [Ambrosiozyma monospora]
MFEGSHNAQEIAHHSDTIKNFPDDPDLQFVLIAWNDEFHGWEEAKACLRQALSGTHSPSYTFKNLALEIDKHGYAPVLVKDTIEELIKPCQALQTQNGFPNLGLTGTIMSTKELANFTICDQIIGWLDKMSKHPDVRIAEYVKSTIISVFEDKYEASFTSPEPTSFFESRSSIKHA